MSAPTTIDIRGLSLHERAGRLEAAMAESLGWTWSHTESPYWTNPSGLLMLLPRYASSADTVLELLSHHQWRACSVGRTGADPAYSDAIVWVAKTGQEHEAFASSFAEAACIALLRARGIEVLT